MSSKTSESKSSPGDASKDSIDNNLKEQSSLANYEFKTGANWTQENVQTLMQWVHISAIYLEIMSEATKHYKTLLRRHSVLNLILSTLAGTASLSQFSINENSNPTLTLLLKGFFTVMSFIISISVGYLKIYQIQEKMENTIRLQQEWTVFGSKITSEMQLPENLRKDALFLIIKMKETYFELIKSQVEISKKIMNRVAWRNGLNVGDLSLSEIFERVIKGEALRLSNILKSELESNIDNDGKNFSVNIYDGDESVAPPRRDYEENSEDDEIFSTMKKVGSMLRPKYTTEKLASAKSKLRHVEPPKSRRATLTNREKLTSYLMRPIAPTLGNSSNSYSAGTGLNSPNRRNSTTSTKSKSPKIPTVTDIIPTNIDDSSSEKSDEQLSTIAED
jgi:hypothetical protein